MINWNIKRFEALSPGELYQVLALRSEVFVVEQNCIYHDMDNKDQAALHLIADYEETIVAYARVFAPGVYFDEASIGRVVVRKEFRLNNLGHELMRRSLKTIESAFGKVTVTISAQQYLQKFYEAHGFCTVGETYLEDGIPHIRMTRPNPL